MHRLKLLYDFEWESNLVVLIQATLLHSWWYVSNQDQKDPWFWLGICISLATGIGMNKQSIYAPKDEGSRRLWRRIWWTCVSRDRLMCILTRKPMRIKDAEINLPKLKFKDFDTKPLNTKTPFLRDCPLITECIPRVMLADIFMAKVNLLLIGGDIFHRLYNLQAFSCTSSEWSMWYTPKRKHELEMDSFFRSQGELNRWSSNLNNYCRINYQDDDESQGNLGQVMRVHRTALKLLHLMIQEASHRPLIYPADTILQSNAGGQCSVDEGSTSTARTIVTQTASEISDTFGQLRAQNLVEFLPPLAVGCILTAVASWRVEMMLAKKPPADMPGPQYHECLYSLLILREIWPIADAALTMINRMATTRQIWFAKPLLAEPIAEPLNDPSTRETLQDFNPESQDRMLNVRSPRGLASATEDLHPRQILPTVLPSQTNDQVNENPDLRSSAETTYLASMYPFPWSTVDFETFVSQDSFLDSGMDTFDIGASLDCPLTCTPSSLGAIISEVSSVQNKELHDSWTA